MTSYNETLQNVLAEYQRATSLPSISKVVRDRITTTYGLPAGWGKGMEQSAISLEAGQAVLKKFLAEQAKTKPPTDGSGTGGTGGGTTTPPTSGGGSSTSGGSSGGGTSGGSTSSGGTTATRSGTSTSSGSTYTPLLPDTAMGTGGGTAGLQPITVNLISPTTFQAALTKFGLTGKVSYNSVPKAILNNYTMWYEYLRSLREQYGDLKPTTSSSQPTVTYKPPTSYGSTAPTPIYTAPVVKQPITYTPPGSSYSIKAPTM